MQKYDKKDNAVLIYFLVLILIVIGNMINDVDILDIVYLITLICGVLKSVLIMKEERK